MLNVLLCIGTKHDWRLVAAAALVCVLGAATTVFLLTRTPLFPRWRKLAWLAMTGVVAGSATFTTHFVAMLAFRAGLPIAFAPLETGASLAVAVFGSIAAFVLVDIGAPRADLRRTIVAGAVLGGVIGVMHYLGMASVRSIGHLVWSPDYVLASLVCGGAFSAVALTQARRGAATARFAVATLALVTAIAGLHFTGMTAVTLVPDTRVAMPGGMISGSFMAVMVVAGVVLIAAIALAGAALDTASRVGNLRQLRDALNALPDGVAVFDPTSRLVAWNDRFADLRGRRGVRLFAGMSYDELLNQGLAVGDYPDAEGREEAWLATHHALRDCGESLAQRTRDGRWLRISERRTADGGTIRSCIDITELKRAEADLIAARDEANEAARRADEAEAIAGLGHWRLDVGTLAMDWSAELYRIYGLEPGSPLDFDAITSMTHHDDARTMLERLQRQMRDGDADQNSITRIVSATGELRYLLGNSRGAFGPDGKVTAVIGTAVDVTDQKQLEARMAAAKAEAEAAAQVKAEFLANMSHELRTPLTSIIGFTGLAADQPTLPPLARTYIERVRDASQALLCTVNDILDFSKLEAGQVAIHPAPVDLRALCEATLDLFAPQAGAKDIRLVLDSADLDRRVLMLDADRIRQVLLNLIGNAVKFAATGSVTLRLRYDASSEALTLDVIDTGPGIAPDKHAALFKRFSQIDGSTSRAAGGTGLGLAICKGLVEAMGGRIGLESREGEGARFWIELRSPAAAQLDVAAAAPAMQAPEEGLRVLVVDDHPANRELARLYLAAVGAEVTEAASGADALRLAAAAPFDVILLDLRMPGIDGLEVLRRLRAEGGVNDNTPVLAYTADAGDGVFAKLHQLGFVGVVGKPVAPADLIRKVSAAVAATAMDERDAA